METPKLSAVSWKHRKVLNLLLEDSRGQPFAAARAPRRDNLAATDCRHPGAKPMPAFAHNFAWLIGPFHRAAPTSVPIAQQVPARQDPKLERQAHIEARSAKRRRRGLASLTPFAARAPPKITLTGLYFRTLFLWPCMGKPPTKNFALARNVQVSIHETHGALLSRDLRIAVIDAESVARRHY